MVLDGVNVCGEDSGYVGNLAEEKDHSKEE